MHRKCHLMCLPILGLALMGASVVPEARAASGPSLPAQTNRVVNELTTLTVTNTASDTNLVAQLSTNTFWFTYSVT